jgi:hypothetical protein
MNMKKEMDKTDTRQWYKNYLQTDHWRELRLAKLEDSKNRCEWCKCKTRLEVHHKRYNAFHETFADLQVLCEDCHERIHAKEKQKESAKNTPSPQAISSREKHIITELCESIRCATKAGNKTSVKAYKLLLESIQTDAQSILRLLK